VVYTFVLGAGLEHWEAIAEGGSRDGIWNENASRVAADDDCANM
jgi:hypothetical protein